MGAIVPVATGLFSGLGGAASTLATVGSALSAVSTISGMFSSGPDYGSSVAPVQIPQGTALPTVPTQEAVAMQDEQNKQNAMRRARISKTKTGALETSEGGDSSAAAVKKTTLLGG
jgi:hypothetical protein